MDRQEIATSAGSGFLVLLVFLLGIMSGSAGYIIAQKSGAISPDYYVAFYPGSQMQFFDAHCRPLAEMFPEKK